MPRRLNLFARLHKWASRQEENFLTESLAVLLDMLLEREPAAGARLVAALTNGFILVEAEAAGTIEIRTQVSTTEGRPDLEIGTPDHLAVLEVKAESVLRRGQLEGYREYLRASEFARTLLIVLTKYPPVLPKDAEQPNAVIRWYELADCIERELSQSSISEPICYFLCQQFHDFLKERGMTIAQVDWHLSDGARAIRNFLVMLQEAARACHVSAKKSMSLEYVGFNLDEGKYWIGLYFEEPQKLWFGTRCRINPDAAARLEEGSVETESWIPGGYRWCRAGELESEQVHFYHRSKVGQMQWLEKFLRECLEIARRIETPDQPPAPPEEAEE